MLSQGTDKSADSNHWKMNLLYLLRVMLELIEHAETLAYHSLPFGPLFMQGSKRLSMPWFSIQLQYSAAGVFSSALPGIVYCCLSHCLRTPD